MKTRNPAAPAATRSILPAETHISDEHGVLVSVRRLTRSEALVMTLCSGAASNSLRASIALSPRTAVDVARALRMQAEALVTTAAAHVVANSAELFEGGAA